MGDVGYGSSSGAGLDWGYGSKTPSSWTETDAGYGSYSVAAVEPFVTVPASHRIMDEGGELVTLRAAWAVQGPYKVKLVGQDGTLYPTTGNCYSAVAGGTDLCLTDRALDSLDFATPPAPPGLYNIRLRFGAGFTSEILIVGALLVVRRHRARETYRIRGKLPGNNHLTGPRSVTAEDPI